MAKPTGSKDPKTGNDFIQKAKQAGAHVTPAGKKRGVLFSKIETRDGSMYITPGDDVLDPRTRKNYRHWFRLLGLLTLIGLPLLGLVDYFWGVLQLPPLW